MCDDLGVRFVDSPDEAKDHGFLKRECYGADATHANWHYGETGFYCSWNGAADRQQGLILMPHPYRALPGQGPSGADRSAQIKAADIDPVGLLDLQITPEMKVATAGSCFAQHIARHLKKSGLQLLCR